MGRLIEQQAVMDCLTNTAKYYEREDADEWTKGIHYGLLHGLDNILDNVPEVEAIPKDQYEARLKNILNKLKVRMKDRDEDNGGEPLNAVDRGYHLAYEHLCEEIDNLLKENKDGKIN